MELNIAQLGQKATIYLTEFLPEIARDKHFVPFRACRFDLPTINPAHGFDRFRAHRQQKALRRLQQQIVAIGTVKPQEARDQAMVEARRQKVEKLEQRYWPAKADLAIRHARIARRVDHYRAA